MVQFYFHSQGFKDNETRLRMIKQFAVKLTVNSEVGLQPRIA